jgi:hypothetical protein
MEYFDSQFVTFFDADRIGDTITKLRFIPNNRRKAPKAVCLSMHRLIVIEIKLQTYMSSRNLEIECLSHNVINRIRLKGSKGTE